MPVAPQTPSVEQAVYNILQSAPEAKAKGGRQILSCLAHNEPGVITRVSSILQSRGFNIESFVAAHTELPGLSRMTVVLNGDENQIEQAKRQLEDIVRELFFIGVLAADTVDVGADVGRAGLYQHQARRA